MDEQPDESLSRSNKPELDEVVQEAERKFRQGMNVINEWGSQAREIIQKNPGAVLAGVAILGFVTGLALRKLAMGESSWESRGGRR